MLRFRLFLLLLCCSFRFLPAQPYIPGQAYFSSEAYIEYLAGNLPLIISVPHGGNLEPASIPDRNCPGCVYVTDLNTQELGRVLQQAIFRQTGCYPHVIINRLRRTKLDANRDASEATGGNAEALPAWEAFHRFVDDAKSTVNDQFGKGLFIDLHGHGHDIQRLELGYLLSGSELRQDDQILNSTSWTNQSSIRRLAENNLQQHSHVELLRGDQSLGSWLADQGYPSVPSDEDPAPQSGEPYFSGGYNTRRHGSVSEGAIDAIQIECNFQGVRDTEIAMDIFAERLSMVLTAYLQQHYFGEDGGFCRPTAVDEPLLLPVRVFPNPSCGQFSVVLPSEGSTETEWQLFDALGRLHAEFQNLPAVLTLAPDRFPNGIYWLVARKKGMLAARQPILQSCN